MGMPARQQKIKYGRFGINEEMAEYKIEEKITKALELHKADKLDEAQNLYSEILTNIPDNSEASLMIYTLLAHIEKSNKNFDKAIELFEKALYINPNLPDIYREIGDICYLYKNIPQKTIECYQKYLNFNPDNEDAKASMGLAYLKIKDFENGWKYFESRPQKQSAIERRIKASNVLLKIKPLWKGENISDKTLFVYYDAGLGDNIMFSRFLPLAKSKCKKLLFKPQENLAKLYKDSDFDFVIIEDEDESKLKYDFHCSLMSLPYLLNIKDEKDILRTECYLKSNPKKIDEFKQKYLDNDKFKIGIKWQGKITDYTQKTIPIEAFFKLFEIPNTQFYSLQKERGEDELKKIQKYGVIDLSKEINDFSDTAAIIENLDLVICNDTSVAHLAGALGKQCWVLLPFVQDWRWSNDLSYCYWYKSLKLFKQNETQNWNDLMEKVFIELSF